MDEDGFEDFEMPDFIYANLKRFRCRGIVSKASSHWDYESRQDFETTSLLYNGSIRLFEKSWNMPDDLKNNMNELFQLSRKYFLMITHSNDFVNNNTIKLSCYQYELMRNDVSSFLYFILFYIKRYSDTLNDGFVDNLKKLLADFQILICQFLNAEQLPLIYQCLESNKNDLKCHKVHCHFETFWLTIEIFNDIKEVMSNMSIDLHINTESHTKSLITLLFMLSRMKYLNIDKPQFMKLSPFHCFCINELWQLLILKENFWTLMKDVVHQMDAKGFEKDYTLWFLLNLLMIKCKDNNKTSAKYDLFNDVLKSYLNQKIIAENTMRNLIPLIERVICLWNHGKTEPVVLLLEFFQNRFNNSFYLNGLPIESFCTMKKDPFEFVHQIKMKFNRDGAEYDDNSYGLFLHLLATHLKATPKNSVSVLRLCGRIFLKFPVTRVDKLQGLLDIGLYNLSLLFLTVGMGTHASTTIMKLVELMSLMPRIEVTISSKQLEVIWKSYGASLLILFELQELYILKECLKLVLPHAEWCIKNDFIVPLRHFLDVMKYFLSQDPLSVLAVEIVIDSWIEKYLKSCSRSDIPPMLNAFVELLQTCAKSDVNRMVHIKEKLTTTILPTLLPTAHPMAAELAAYFVIIAPRHRATIFSQWSEHYDANVTAKFLCTLLNHNDPLILSQYPQIPVLLMQTWIRSCIENGDSEETQEIVKIVQTLSHFKGIAIDWDCNQPLSALITFYADKYANYQTTTERAVLRENFTSYFNKLDKWLETIMKTVHELKYEVVSRIFHYSSFLVLKAYQLIYTRSNPSSLLKGLIDVLLLPSSVYKPEHKLNTSVLKALCQYMPRFIKGLCSLDLKNDVYITRVLRDLITNYITRLDSICSDKIHPFMTLLDDPHCSDPVLDVFVQFRNRASDKQTLCVLKMIKHACMEYTPEAAQEIAKKTLDFIFDLILIYDDHHPNWEWSIHCLKLYLEWPNVRAKIPEVLISSCQKNLAFNAAQWFGMITRVAHLCSEEVHHILPAILNEITAVEKRRGVFEDTVLRQRFEKLQSSIGAKP